MGEVGAGGCLLVFASASCVVCLVGRGVLAPLPVRRRLPRVGLVVPLSRFLAAFRLARLAVRSWPVFRAVTFYYSIRYISSGSFLPRARGLRCAVWPSRASPASAFSLGVLVVSSSSVLSSALAACAALPAGARVFVAGSRSFPALSLVSSFVAGLPSGVVVVSGGAAGPDAVAVSSARSRGLAVSVLAADWSRGRSAGVARSASLVSSASVVVVFLCCGSAGSSATVALARRAGVPVFVVPCGCVAPVAAPSLWG